MRHPLTVLLSLTLASAASFDLAAPSAHAAPPEAATAPASAAASAPASAAASAPASAAASAPAGVGYQTLKAVPPVALKLKLDAVESASAEDLIPLLKKNELKRQDLRDPANAQRFLYLAAQQKDPELVSQALLAMRVIYRPKQPPIKAKAKVSGKPKEAPKYAIIDDHFRSVVRARMESKDDRVFDAAFTLSSKLLASEKPDEAALKIALAALGSPSPARRARAIEALYNVPDFQLDKARKGPIKERILGQILNALEKESNPGVLVKGINAIANSAFAQMPLLPRVRALAERYKAHENVSLKASSLYLLSRIEPAKHEALNAALTEALASPEPILRGVATLASDRLPDAVALPALLKLSADSSKPMYDFEGFVGLDGKPAQISNRFGGRRLDISALDALDQRLKAKGFKPAKLDKADFNEQLKARQDAVKAWFEKHPLPAAAAEKPAK